MHCFEYISYHSGFLCNLRLPWNTEFTLKIFTVLNILLHSGLLSNLPLPWKTKCSLNSLHWIYIFYLSEFLSNLRLPWKTELLWYFSLYWNIFIIQDFWATCACPENRVCIENFHCIEWMRFLHSGFLSNLHLPWNTEFALNSLYWRYIFIFQDFWATCTCFENRVCPDFTVLNLYFLLFRILNNLRLPWKTEFALKIFLYWNIFHLSRFLSDLRLPWKQNLPWFFQTRVGGRPPASYTTVYSYMWTIVIFIVLKNVSQLQ